MVSRIVFATLAFFFTLQCASAQTPEYLQQRQQVKDAIKESKSKGSTAPLDALLASGVLKDKQVVSEALTAKASLTTRQYKLKTLKADMANNGPLTRSILATYQQAIDTCPRCDLQPIYNRYQLLEKLDHYDNPYKNDLETLRHAGLKRTTIGVVIGPQYMLGRDHWLGGEVALAGVFQPAYKMGKTDPDTKQYMTFRKTPPVAMSALTFSYFRNLSENANDFSFSLGQFTSPVALNLTRFGWQSGDYWNDRRAWFYRPDIGVGFGRISLHYAYQLMLKKADRDRAEKHLFQVKFLQVFGKKR